MPSDPVDPSSVTPSGQFSAGTRTGLATAIRRVAESRGLNTRGLVNRVPRRHVGTVYRLLAGRTTDPWASTVMAVTAAMDSHPDELLGAKQPVLDPELELVLGDMGQLSEDDQWLVLAMLRPVLTKMRNSPSGLIPQ